MECHKETICTLHTFLETNTPPQKKKKIPRFEQFSPKPRVSNKHVGRIRPAGVQPAGNRLRTPAPTSQALEMACSINISCCRIISAGRVALLL